MKIETILHLIDYAKSIQETEESLQNIGWDVHIPSNTETYSIYEIILDLMNIPPDAGGGDFTRDCYFDCFFTVTSKDAIDIYNALNQTYKDFLPEYIKAGLIDQK